MESIRRRSSGLRRESSLAAWMPVIRGMLTSRTARSTSSASPLRAPLGAVAGFRDDLQIGLGVKDATEAAPDDGVVVGEQYARARARTHGCSMRGTARDTSVPPP